MAACFRGAKARSRINNRQKGRPRAKKHDAKRTQLHLGARRQTTRKMRTRTRTQTRRYRKPTGFRNGLTYPRKTTRDGLSQATTATTAQAGHSHTCDRGVKSGGSEEGIVGGFHGNLFLYNQEVASLTFGWHRARGCGLVAGASLSLSLSASV